MKAYYFLKVNFFFSFLLACGMPPQKEAKVRINEKLILKKENLKDRTLENSYLVAFDLEKNKAKALSAWANLDKFFYSEFSYLFENSSDIKSITPITEANLTNLLKSSLSFSKNISFFNAYKSPFNEFSEAYLLDKDEQNIILSRVDFKNFNAAEKHLKDWISDGRVSFADPNYNNELFQNTSTTPTADQYSNLKSYWMEAIHLSSAVSYVETQAASLGIDLYDDNSRPVIAILDSGVDYQHPSLADQILQNPKPGVNCNDDSYGCNTAKAGKGKLGEGNSYPFGVEGPGKSCPGAADKKTSDYCSHGTHVAGLAAAKPGSSVGGACPFCMILPIRIVDTTDDSDQPQILDSSIAAGLKYLTLFNKPGTPFRRVRVANCSFGKFSRSRAVNVLVRMVTNPPGDPFGTLIVAASGNEDSMAFTFPAAYSDVLSVSSVRSQKNSYTKAHYSNFGSWVDIAAPGGDSKVQESANSTLPGSSNGGKEGTSMAAPMVAGVAGLVSSLYPNLNAGELYSTIINSADDIYGEAGTVNSDYYLAKDENGVEIPLIGQGIINAENAVKKESGTKRQKGEKAQRVPDNAISCAVISNHPSILQKLLILWLLCIPLSFPLFKRLT